MLTGVLYPTSGKIEVMGYEPFSQRGRYVARIGAVFGQKSQLIWDIPPLDSFALNKAIYNIPSVDYNKRLHKIVELLEIADVINKPARALSLGERMKCEFVMAMLHAPRVVFLDEPTIGVDLIAKDAIRGFIREMNAEGVTFILTTHDLEDIERLARRAIIINHGEIVFNDSLDTLRKHLGDLKIVRIVMKDPIDMAKSPELAGMRVSSCPNEREVQLMVDRAITSMNSLIGYLSELGDILDISIKEPGIEAIIKSLYLYGDRQAKSDEGRDVKNRSEGQSDVNRDVKNRD
jgi:ABC-2 type transport system ATP-binding protein